MNDHNLDDLIIDNIDPKNSKTKSFLTIIALAIVVLIVAIILTKIILKEPSQQILLEEENSVMISPDLTLQSDTSHTPKKTETTTDKLALHTEKQVKPVPTIVEKPTETKPKQIVTQKPTTVKITKEFSQEPNLDIQEEAKIASEKKALAEKLAQEEKIAKAKKELQAKKEKAREQERLAEEKVKQQAQAKKTKGYFIQVGSFTQTPSTHFLSVIKNSGFNYKITPPSATGTKKLLIGPYASRAEVDTALVRVRDRINKSAFVIKK